MSDFERAKSLKHKSPRPRPQHDQAAELRAARKAGRHPDGLLIRGWWCACDIFNGEEEEQRLACRSCDRPKGLVEPATRITQHVMPYSVQVWAAPSSSAAEGSNEKGKAT